MSLSLLPLYVRRLAFGSLSSVQRVFGIGVPPITILGYHSFSCDSYRYAIDPLLFEQQLERLSRHVHFVSLDAVVRAVTLGESLPIPAVALTFDDGYADVLDVLPITQRYGAPVTLFVMSDPVDVDRRSLANGLPLLSWDAIRFLQSHGWTVGSHSATHPDLCAVDSAQLVAEVAQSRRTLERELGCSVRYFAYPLGSYDERVRDAVCSAGYDAAFGIDPSPVTSRSDTYALPRTLIDCTHAVSEFPAVFSSPVLRARRLTDRFRLWDRFLRYA